MKSLLLLILTISMSCNVMAQKVAVSNFGQAKDTPDNELLDDRSFEVKFLNQQNQNPFFKLQRMEIGVELPLRINGKVRNFVDRFSSDTNYLINPYLEWELKVEARFIFENDTLNPILVDGFYLQNYQSFMKNPLPEPNNGAYYTDEEYLKLGGWRKLENQFPFHIRFAPPKAGSWRMQIRIQTVDDLFLSPIFDFFVDESENHGYMQVAENKRFLQLDESPFYPVGMNTPWPETAPEFDSTLYSYNIIKDQNTTWYRPEMYREKGFCVPRVYDQYKGIWSKMSESGVNYVRTIMNPISTEIEWEKLGDYTNRLNQAQEMDELLEFAEAKNLFIHWDLAIHYTFKYNVYYLTQWDWIDNDGTPSYCYKKAFNLDNPIDFFTNENCKKYYKQRLRYILARWGYSPNIAAFEIISEISNIGSNADDDSEFYQKNAKAFQDWQIEMGDYLKSMYNGKIHLLTASYSGEMSRNDSTFFKSKSYDFMTSNIYDFGTADFARFFTKAVSKRLLNESQIKLSDNAYNLRVSEIEGEKIFSYNIKSLMFSESEPIDCSKNCKRNEIEINRSQWQSLFSGLAAYLSWTGWYLTDNYKVYGQMQKWISTVDFLYGDWHPGASEVLENDSLKRWNYNYKYAEAMDATWRKADLSYLRSGQKSEAIGVLTNKTYNVYNIDTCLTIPIDIQHLAKREAVDLKKQKLKIKGMKRGTYQVDYYLPANQDEPIFTSLQFGKNLNITLPSIAATKEGYIVLFRVSQLVKE